MRLQVAISLNMGDAPYPTPLIYLDVCNRHKGP